MEITALAPWFGSKRSLAPRIVEALGKHSAYWEPFCGGMSVILNKPEASHETVNDLHGDLINLARVIADLEMAERLYTRLSRVLCDEHRRTESLEILRQTEDPQERAFHYFIVSWFGRNGFSGTVGCEKSSFAIRWTPNGGHGGKRFRSAVESIPAWHNRLRPVTIINRDGFKVLEKITDQAGVVIYVDPPYFVKAAKYQYDFENHEHEELAGLLHRFKATRVVLSYYAHPKLGELYPDWRQRPIEVSKNLVSASKREANEVTATEVLLTNEPPGLF